MPTKDLYHDIVVRALFTDEWRVSPKQHRLNLPERRLGVDISATRLSDGFHILVEVKVFENMPSPVDYLKSALGQYLLYRGILHRNKDNTPLYMAVPESAFNGILFDC